MQRYLKALTQPHRTFTYLSRLARPADPDIARRRRWAYGTLPRLTLQELFGDAIRGMNITLLNTFDRRPGWSLDVNELCVLCTIAKSIQARKLLEIGTYDGNTALNLAVNSPDDACVTTIDLLDATLDAAVPREYQNTHHGQKIGQQFVGTTIARKIHQVYGDSAALDWRKLPGPFDLVFIDGCHFYDYVRSDTQNALSVVRPGGVVVWHDYAQFYDVTRAVDEVSTTNSLKVAAIQSTRLAVAIRPTDAK